MKVFFTLLSPRNVKIPVALQDDVNCGPPVEVLVFSFTKHLSTFLHKCFINHIFKYLDHLEGQHYWYSGMQCSAVPSIPSPWIHGAVSWHWSTDGSVDCCQHQPAHRKRHECMVTWYGREKGWPYGQCKSLGQISSQFLQYQNVVLDDCSDIW